MFETNELGKSFDAGPQPELGPGHRPEPQGAAGPIDVALNVNADDIDNRLIAGDLDVDVAGTGVAAGRAGQDPGRPELKANADNAPRPALWYTSSTATSRRSTTSHCRKAVEYAADKIGYQRAYGGADRRRHRHQPAAAGDRRAPEVRPLPGRPDNTGDVAKAKDGLTACGQPERLHHHIAYRAERPKEKATAEALQQSLAQGRHQADAQAATRPATTSSSTPASRTTRRRTTSA